MKYANMDTSNSEEYKAAETLLSFSKNHSTKLEQSDHDEDYPHVSVDPSAIISSMPSTENECGNQSVNTSSCSPIKAPEIKPCHSNLKSLNLMSPCSAPRPIKKRPYRYPAVEDYSAPSHTPVSNYQASECILAPPSSVTSVDAFARCGPDWWASPSCLQSSQNSLEPRDLIAKQTALDCFGSSGCSALTSQANTETTSRRSLDTKAIHRSYSQDRNYNCKPYEKKRNFSGSHILRATLLGQCTAGNHCTMAADAVTKKLGNQYSVRDMLTMEPAVKPAASKETISFNLNGYSCNKPPKSTSEGWLGMTFKDIVLESTLSPSMPDSSEKVLFSVGDTSKRMGSRERAKSGSAIQKQTKALGCNKNEKQFGYYTEDIGSALIDKKAENTIFTHEFLKNNMTNRSYNALVGEQAHSNMSTFDCPMSSTTYNVNTSVKQLSPFASTANISSLPYNITQRLVAGNLCSSTLPNSISSSASSTSRSWSPIPSSNSMILTGINGVILPIPSSPTTIQVIVVNNYATTTSSTQNSPPDACEPCGSSNCNTSDVAKLRPLAPAPPASSSSTSWPGKECLPSGNLAFKLKNSRQKTYRCEYPSCEKTYYKNSHLKVHQRLHTGEKPFPCKWDGCDKKFARSDELSRHHRTHTGEKVYFKNSFHQMWSLQLLGIFLSKL